MTINKVLAIMFLSIVVLCVGASTPAAALMTSISGDVTQGLNMVP